MLQKTYFKGFEADMQIIFKDQGTQLLQTFGFPFFRFLAAFSFYHQKDDHDGSP